MADFILQTADWKVEKHIPVIEVKEAKKDVPIKVNIKVGKEIPHPNTAEHHIKSIEAYYLIPDEKFPFLLGRFEFSSHGESTKGPNTSMVYSEPEVNFSFSTARSGKILAIAHCNIHGLWQNNQEVNVE